MDMPTKEKFVSNFKKVRALVVEPPAENSTANILKNLGCDVQSEANPEKIHALLKHGIIIFSPFHLVILDEQVIGQDLNRTMENIRKESFGQKIKVILLSSSEDKLADVVPAVDHQLHKPVQEQAVREALQNILAVKFEPKPIVADKGSVLIVEDDELSLELMRILLTKHGYKVTIAVNGVEAVKEFETKSFDLVLMDLQMPLLDGIATARKIRELEGGSSRVPIIILTASNIPAATAFQKVNAEIDKVLSKPFNVQTVLQIVETLTENQRKRSKAQAEAPGIMDVVKALPRFGLDREQYIDIFEEFQQSLPGRLTEMNESFRTLDTEKLGRLAHNLKGVSANVGAMQLSSIAARLDEQCDGNDFDLIGKTLENLRDAAEFLRSNAQQLINDYFSSTAHPQEG